MKPKIAGQFYKLFSDQLSRKLIEQMNPVFAQSREKKNEFIVYFCEK